MSKKDLINTLVSRVFNRGKHVGSNVYVAIDPSHVSKMVALIRDTRAYTKLYIRKKFIHLYQRVGVPGGGIGTDKNGLYLLINMTISSARTTFCTRGSCQST